MLALLPDRIHKVETQDIEAVSTFTIILTALFMFRLLCICIYQSLHYKEPLSVFSGFLLHKPRRLDYVENDYK